MPREIRIVGGGLAGLALGLFLRRDAVPTEVIEAGTYPRPKVCGEFISGRGAEILQQLDVARLESTFTAHSVRFFDGARSSELLNLPKAGIAVDRSTLDDSLAHAFRHSGGVLRENSRWTESFASEGLVRATGRRLTNGNSGSMVGIKAHARNVELCADLELHFSDAGYVGLSRQGGGTVNVCALFVSKSALNRAATSERDFLKLFTHEMGCALSERLNHAVFETATFAAVAGISLQPEKASATAECRIGDSICMIPPITGNGMSIALESASIAAPILRDYSHGKIEWHRAQELISRQCDGSFKRRLAAAAILQRFSLHPNGRRLLLKALHLFPGTFNASFWLTR